MNIKNLILYREAKKAFQFAVKLNPKNEIYYHTLGNCLRKMKKHKEAIEMYEKFGYTVLGRRKNFYRCPVEDALLMTKRKV